MHHGDDFRELWRRKVLVFLTFSLERDNSCRLGVSVVHVAHGSFFRCVPASQAEKSCAAPSIGHQRDEAILHIDSFGCDNQFKPIGSLRFPGVLQRIGITYFVVGILEITFTKRSEVEVRIFIRRSVAVVTSHLNFRTSPAFTTSPWRGPSGSL
jgi:hypothetical protein